MKRLRALKAIRMNYTWHGTLKVLLSPIPEYVLLNGGFPFGKMLDKAPPIVSDHNWRVWELVVLDPQAVIYWQMALAEGIVV